jgi:hypothetical protein
MLYSTELEITVRYRTISCILPKILMSEHRILCADIMSMETALWLTTTTINCSKCFWWITVYISTTMCQTTVTSCHVWYWSGLKVKYYCVYVSLVAVRLHMQWMHMSAEPSPLHDMTLGIMYSVAVTIIYPLMHYSCMACKGFEDGILSADQWSGEGTWLCHYKLKATAAYLSKLN